MAKRVIATAATVEPVSLAELRAHLREPDHAEDEYLASLLSAAVAWCEAYTWSKFCNQTISEYYDGFTSPLPLWYSPVPGTYVDGDGETQVSITSVTYTDTAGDTQTLSTDYYEHGLVDGKGVCRLKYNQSWPSTRSHADVVTATYVTGYGVAADVPVPIQHAIKLAAAHLFNHREDAIEVSLHCIPMGVKAMLTPYVYWEF